MQSGRSKYINLSKKEAVPKITPRGCGTDGRVEKKCVHRIAAANIQQHTHKELNKLNRPNRT